MNSKKKRRKNNFGVKSIEIQYYLNSYFNPSYHPKLEEFYYTFFKENTHEGFETKMDYLKKVIQSEKKDEKIEQFYNEFQEEFDNLCRKANPLNIHTVKECDILSGKIVSVKDVYGVKKYYPTYSPLFEEEFLPVNSEEKRLELRYSR